MSFSRRHLVPVVACVLLPALTTPAVAANQTVAATAVNTFTPALVAVKPGEAVTFKNNGGFHDVAWDDGFPSAPSPASSSDWTVSRKFTAPGIRPYYCQIHGTRGVRGMAGIVFVNAAGVVPAPQISSASALGQVGAVRLTFRTTQPGTLVATVYKRAASGAYVRKGTIGGRAAYGVNLRRVTRTSGGAITAGRYRINLRIRSSAGLSAQRVVFGSAR